VEVDDVLLRAGDVDGTDGSGRAETADASRRELVLSGRRRLGP